jgi:uncharacterized protein (DUF1015 family)
MVSLLPFRSLSPIHDQVDEVAGPPYDVMNRAEARELINDKPNSILRVTRPDALLNDSIPGDSPQAYDVAREELKRLIDQGVLKFDDDASYYIYAQVMGSHRQTGIVGLASAEDYWAARIKKHEYTLPKKEDDRTRQVLSLGAHLGPVFLAHQPHASLKQLIRRYQESSADITHVAPDGILHEIWRVSSPDDVTAVSSHFAELDALYIADGHHRAAAAARVSRELNHEGAHHFLSVSFASDELLVLPYQRVITQWNGDQESLFTQLKQLFEISLCDAPLDRDPSESCVFPPNARSWGMYVSGQWYLLQAKASLLQRLSGRELTAQLDVSILQDEVLRPLFDVNDPRACDHISFVGGIRGYRELEKRVNEHNGVAFALSPTSLQELMKIADGGSVMPPKSTWFEPKLRTGLLISVFDRTTLNLDL